MTDGKAYDARFAVPLLVGPALNPINTTMIAVALAPIASDTGVSAATCIWLVAALYLVSSICQPTMGKFADQFGPRKIYLIGMFILIVAGVIPSFMPTFGGALLARILIGLGTSCAYPAAMTFMADESRRYHVQTPQALLSGISISALVTSAIGPVLGGILVEAFGWQSIFLVNIPLALAVIIMTLLWLPADHDRPARESELPLTQAIDFRGIALFTLTLASALFFLLDIEGRLYWLIPISLIAGVLLVWWERRRERPFFDVNMLITHRPLTRTYIRWFLLTTAAYMVIYGVTQWMQTCMGVSSDVAGLMQLPAALIAFGTSFVVLKTTRVYLPLIVSSAAMIICGVFICLLHSASPLWFAVLAIAIYGVPHGLNNISNQAAMYRQAPLKQMGNAAGLSRTAIQVGAVVTSCIIGSVYGQTPTDAGVHILGLIMIGLALCTLIMVIFDRSLRKPLLDNEDI